MQPGQATNVLNDRIRLINKVNSDVADWLQVRFLSIGPSIHSAIGTDAFDFCDRSDDGLKRHMRKVCESLLHGPSWIMAPRSGKLERRGKSVHISLRPKGTKLINVMTIVFSSCRGSAYLTRLKPSLRRTRALRRRSTMMSSIH